MPRPHITIDFETRSYADLTKVGAWAYSEHPTTDTICGCWGIDDQPVQEWWPSWIHDGDDAMPNDLYCAIEDGATIEAHNVAFERSIFRNILMKRYGWLEPAHDQWRDLMATACYYAMPAKLDKLARVLGYPGKDPAGARLITKYSKLYLKTAKLDIPGKDFDSFVEYCRTDVLLEQACSDELGDLPEREVPVFLLDQQMNMRGLHLDQDGIDAATYIVDQRAGDLTLEFRKLTSPTGYEKDGLNPTQRDRVMEWFETHNLKLENMKAEYLEELLEEGSISQGPARRALEIRLAINKASTKKLDAMSRQRGEDGRARFQSRYHGALTGRPTGTGFQPLNLVKSYEDIPPERLVADIMHRDPLWLDCVYNGNAMDAIAKASRHWIQAQPGSKIIAGDFVSIEAVVLACLAREAWKIKAFEEKHPIYAIMGCKIHGIDVNEALTLGDSAFKKKYPDERFDGKTGELAFGYQGALNAWLKFDNSGRHTDEIIISHCKSWRGEHPATLDMWEGLGLAALEAVRNPGRTVNYLDIGFQVVDEWLTMIAPDGKRIWYRQPEIRALMPQWHTPYIPFLKDGEPNPCHTKECECKPRPTVTYICQKEGQWKRVSTYGGKLTENACQLTARQILAAAMGRLSKEWDIPLRKRNYIRDEESCMILSVYDEVVAEVPLDFGSKEEIEEIMAERPAFAKTWPIRVDAWEGDRYKK